jgi:hypothetical protein
MKTFMVRILKAVADAGAFVAAGSVSARIN